MDWAEDFSGVSEEDFQKVWKYEEKHTTVVRLTSADEVCLFTTIDVSEDH